MERTAASGHAKQPRSAKHARLHTRTRMAAVQRFLPSSSWTAVRTGRGCSTAHLWSTTASTPSRTTKTRARTTVHAAAISLCPHVARHEERWCTCDSQILGGWSWSVTAPKREPVEAAPCLRQPLFEAAMAPYVLHQAAPRTPTIRACCFRASVSCGSYLPSTSRTQRIARKPAHTPLRGQMASSRQRAGRRSSQTTSSALQARWRSTPNRRASSTGPAPRAQCITPHAPPPILHAPHLPSYTCPTHRLPARRTPSARRRSSRRCGARASCTPAPGCYAS